MINVIIPIIDKNKDKYTKLLTELDGMDEIKIHVGVEEKNALSFQKFEDSENIIIEKFQDGSNFEGMINAIHRYAGAGATLVLRKPINFEEFSKFVNCSHDIATCSVKRSKFKNFIFNAWQAIIRLFLGIREYEGDTSVVYLSEDISTVVGQSGNLSFSTRANRWRGVEQTTIETKEEPVKNEINKKSILKYSLFAIISILLAITITTVVCITVKVSVLVGLLLICLDMICLAISILTIIIAIFNCRIGAKRVEDSKYSLDIK